MHMEIYQQDRIAVIDAEITSYSVFQLMLYCDVVMHHSDFCLRSAWIGNCSMWDSGESPTDGWLCSKWTAHAKLADTEMRGAEGDTLHYLPWETRFRSPTVSDSVEILCTHQLDQRNVTPHTTASFQLSSDLLSVVCSLTDSPITLMAIASRV